MKRGKQFKTVVRPKIRRNKFDLSHEKRLTADMFWLIPVLLDDCIPGDHWKIGNEVVVRMNPLVAPIMHEINLFVHYYFVPYRLLWDQWENFITGGQDGNFVADIPRFPNLHASLCESGSLWDYFGFNIMPSGGDFLLSDMLIKFPVAFPLRAYNMIWNEFYRDPNLDSPVNIESYDSSNIDYVGLRLRCWEKDYFTSMLPWQQRGQTPGFPVHINDTSAEFNMAWRSYQQTTIGSNYMSPSNYFGKYLLEMSGTVAGSQDEINDVFNDNVVRNSGYGEFDVSDLRLAFQIQKFLERNARVGYRYVEQLKAGYNAWPRDDRLQRPEYIGGSKTPIVISEVLQTSASVDGQTSQGNMAGHGLSADRTFVGSYRVQEHGLIMGIMSILPKPMYSQGIDRVWLKDTKYDFYRNEFAHLSEQAVYTEELYNYQPAPVDRILGYQGRWDEHRFKRNSVHGKFLTDLDFQAWHMARKFASTPTLNSDLVRPNYNERQALKRCLAATTEPMFLISFGNKCHVTRGMPFMSTPGLVDH